MSIELLEVQDQEVQQMKADGAALVAQARAFLVVDEASCLAADQAASLCDQRAKNGKARLEKTRKSMYDAYQNVLDLIKEVAGPFEAARKIFNDKIYSWRSEEKRRREAEAAKQREADKKRIEDERLKQAQKVSDAGRPDLADKILDEKIIVPAPEPPKIESVAGSVMKENWKGRVVDESVLPREFMTPDLVKLNKVTKAMKGATRISGWEVWDEGTIARSSK